MFAQRLTQHSARRAFAHIPRNGSGVIMPRTKFNPAPAMFAASNRRIQYRPIATESVPVDSSILAAQRLRRPISPHLSIYRPQITWYLSMLNRITGSVLSGGFYIFGFTYLISPLFGWHFFDSAVMASAFGSLPWWGKAAVKFGVAMPFTFHSFNGVRHLVWDMGRELSNRAVQVTGWTVVGATVLTSGALAAM